MTTLFEANYTHVGEVDEVFMVGFAPRAAQLLNTEESFQVIFNLKQEDLEHLARGLTSLFVDTNVFKVHV
jgi:hypothetical protein